MTPEQRAKDFLLSHAALCKIGEACGRPSPECRCKAMVEGLAALLSEVAAEAAPLFAAETEAALRAEQWRRRRQAESERDVAKAAAEALRAERDALRAELAAKAAQLEAILNLHADLIHRVAVDRFNAPAGRVR